MEAAYRNETGESYDEWLDSISSVTIAGDFGSIRGSYEDDPELRVAASLLPTAPG
jgi:hypothetical protein